MKATVYLVSGNMVEFSNVVSIRPQEGMVCISYFEGNDLKRHYYPINSIASIQCDEVYSKSF